MAIEVRCDPTLQPGEVCSAGRRTMVGEAMLWVPGGDADKYVEFVGVGVLVNVAGDVYRRWSPSRLELHSLIRDRHVVFRPVAGDPLFMSEHQFLTEFARIVAVEPAPVPVPGSLEWLTNSDGPVENAGPVVAPPDIAPEQVGDDDRHESSPTDLRRGPGRPKGSKNKPAGTV